MDSNKIKIYINSPKPYYYSGEQFLASILIDALDTINSNKIIITAKGIEIVKATQKIISLEGEESEDSEEEQNETNDIDKNLNINSIIEEKSKNNKGFKEINESRIIFKYKKTIKISSNNKLSKGKYTFPFEFDIPEKIPGSFLYLDNSAYVEVLYTVKVKLDNFNIKEIIPIIIRQKQKIFNYPKGSEYSKKIRGCCFEKCETKIKLNIIEKYSLNGNKIKLNIVLNNEKCGMNGSPINIEMYQKLILYPKKKSKKIKITKLVGKYKGKKQIESRNNFNEDISILMNENKFISDNLSKTKVEKYLKNKNIIPLLTQSIKSELIICEYEIYAETQFVGWTIDDLGVFNKIIMYPPEKGILSKEMIQIAKEFSNSIVNKKVFLNNDNNDEEDKLKNNIENDNNKENIESKKDREKKKKIKESKRNKMLLKIKNYKKKEDDKENQNINLNYKNNEDINQNFNINEYKNSCNYNNKITELEFNDCDNFGTSKKSNKKQTNSSNVKKNFNHDYLKDELDNNF